MFPEIKNYCDNLSASFDEIPNERKERLKKIADSIAAKQQQQQPAHLVYICTHNSRRSHFGQVWAAVAAAYYGLENIHAHSGGMEVTAFNPNAINALKRAGFQISGGASQKNPHYKVEFGEGLHTLCFSKVYDDPANPQIEFAAIMVCSDAEENCPFVAGAEARFSTTYDDPKDFDDTPQQDAKYDERCRQIGLETLYLLSLVK